MSGNHSNSPFMTLASISCRSLPLKGRRPYSKTYIQTATAHTSAGGPAFLVNTSGDIVYGVPATYLIFSPCK